MGRVDVTGPPKGGVWAAVFHKSAAAVLVIEGCVAERGGGLFTSDSTVVAADQTQIGNCSAASYGGCFNAGGALRFEGALVLTNCTAKGAGGGMYSPTLVATQPITCDGCAAPTAALAQVFQGNSSLAAVAVTIRSRSSGVTSLIVGEAGSVVEVGALDCREAPLCLVQAPQVQVARLLCQRGEGRQSLADGDEVQCQTCPEGHTRLEAGGLAA